MCICDVMSLHTHSTHNRCMNTQHTHTHTQIPHHHAHTHTHTHTHTRAHTHTPGHTHTHTHTRTHTYVHTYYTHTHTHSHMMKLSLSLAVVGTSMASELVSPFMFSKVNNVQCSATQYCQDGTHCCFYSNGQLAGCCQDGLTCDVAAGTCDSVAANKTM